MDEQLEIPGARPMKCKVPHKRAHRLLLDTGGHAALAVTQRELEKMREQHPGVAGLTLAIAVVARHSAELQMNSSREVLIHAAQVGMPIEQHAIALSFDEDGLYLKASAGKFDGE